MRQASAGNRDFGYLIEPDGHRARLQAQPPLHEAREKITRHRRGGDDRADLQAHPQEGCREGRGDNGKHDAANGLRPAKERLPVREAQASVERIGQPVPKDLPGDDRCAIREGQKHQQRGDLSKIHPANDPLARDLEGRLAFRMRSGCTTFAVAQ